MRKIALVLVLLGGLFIWTGCPEENKGGSGGTAPANSATETKK